MNTHRHKGLTLIELMTSMATGMIVLLAAGSILVAGNRYWEQAWDKINLQRDASYIMHNISRSIRSAKSVELEDDGKAIKIYRNVDWIRISFDEENNAVNYEIADGVPRPLVLDHIEAMEFTVNANRVGISLKLQKDNFQNHFVSTVMMRNFGE